MLFSVLTFGVCRVNAQAPVGWTAHPPVIYAPVSSIKPNVVFANATPPFTPAEIQGAYGLSSLKLPNPTGAGVTVAIVDAYGDDFGGGDTIQSDLQAFCANTGLPYSGPNTASPTLTEPFPATAPPDQGWALETALDIEWVHAMAPAAHIVLVLATNSSDSALFQRVVYAGANASVVSMSWGGSEFSSETSFDSDFLALNVSYFASTGDDGAGTEYPSVSPNVTAVGGTSLTIASNNDWVDETGWSGSGGGVSTYEPFASFQAPWVASGNREVPDISADADPNTGVEVIQGGAEYQVGGTSLAAPLWSGITAVLDGNLSQPIGESALHTALYQLGDPASIDLNFHDITSGSNGFNAGPGYDLVTGIGSPIVNVLLPKIVAPPPSAPTGLTVVSN